MPAAELTSITLDGSLPPLFAPQVYLVRGSFREARPLTPEGTPALDASVRSAVRALLRWGGYKPSGRGRPASESLVKAVEVGRWPTIHPLVDHCNVLSMRSGLPISVVDAGLLIEPLKIRIGQPGESYEFNPSGQVLDLKGILLLADNLGPTGSPVKDAQRTKVSAQTSDFLLVIWGTSDCPEAARTVSSGLLGWCDEQSASCRMLSFSDSALAT